MSKKWLVLILIVFSSTFSPAQNGEDDQITYTIDTIIQPPCYGFNNGSIFLKDISIPGTIQRYRWSNGSTNKDLRTIGAGDYQLTVYDENGKAYKTEVFKIRQPTPIKFETFLSNPTDSHLSDGFIQLTMHGGTAPYTLTLVSKHDTLTIKTEKEYLWTDIDTGYFRFYVIDDHGCMDSTALRVSSLPCELLVSSITTPSECSVSPSGQIEIFIDNAHEPVRINWSNGLRDRTRLFNLKPGIYAMSVVDRRGCVVEDSIEIIEKDLVPPEVKARDNIVVYLDSDKQATLTPEDVMIYAIDLCNNDLEYVLDKTDFSCDDIGNTEVMLNVSDGVGNITATPVMVEVRDTHSVRLIYQDTVYTALCNGEAQYETPRLQGICSASSGAGIVKLTNRRITQPGKYVDRYYYVKSPGDTLRAEITVIVENKNVQAFIIAQEPECSTGEDGILNVALRQYRDPVEYEWFDGSKEEYFIGIVNGKEYNVTVREGSGCVFRLSEKLDGPDSIKISVADIIERGDGVSIITQITGGYPPMTYTWKADGKVISESQNLANVPDGKLYTLEVTDSHNCKSHLLTVDRTRSAAEESKLSSEVLIYPNPGSSSFQSLTIRLGDAYHQFRQIRLINSRQELIRTVHQLSNEISLDISQLPPGVYFFQFLTSDGSMFTRKYLKL